MLAIFEVVRPSIVLEEVMVRAVARRRINKPGFIDHRDGANIRTGPAELGGQTIRKQPLPPATPVFVSSPHRDAPDWWHVAAYTRDGIFQGYVQGFRVNLDLPEPTAKLYYIKRGDTAEKLARQEFSSAVRPGHDLAYYENVLLYVNQLKGRKGITGSYQSRNPVGGGGNNIKLIEEKLIWLVSPGFAKALEQVVPSGSLTGGAIAELREVAQAIQKAIKRFAQALLDILASINESPKYLHEVLAEDAQIILDHFTEIVVVVGGFFMLEGMAAAMAGPTSPLLFQLIALAIEAMLALFGLTAAAKTAAAAIKQGAEWLRLAIQANGRPEEVARASKEFLRMLKSFGLTVLSLMGVKANMGKAWKIANALPSPRMPMLAMANGGTLMMGNAGGRTAVVLGPVNVPAPLGAGGAVVTMRGKKSDGSSGSSRQSPSSLADELKNPKPNHTYKINDYVYKTDALGRTKQVFARLKLKKGVRNNKAQQKVGKSSGVAGDEGGHLLGSRFGGSGEVGNLVPQNSNLNRGAWKKMEIEWADALKRNEAVEVNIKPLYSGSSTRPAGFRVVYSIDNGTGVVEKSRYFKNKPGG